MQETHLAAQPRCGCVPIPGCLKSAASRCCGSGCVGQPSWEQPCADGGRGQIWGCGGSWGRGQAGIPWCGCEHPFPERCMHPTALYVHPIALRTSRSPPCTSQPFAHPVALRNGVQPTAPPAPHNTTCTPCPIAPSAPHNAACIPCPIAPSVPHNAACAPLPTALPTPHNAACTSCPTALPAPHSTPCTP